MGSEGSISLFTDKFLLERLSGLDVVWFIVGYIGSDVAWNLIDGARNQLSFIFLDCLSNSEMLLTEQGEFKGVNGDKAYDDVELYAGLRGKTVYIEVETTSGAWFLSLVGPINLDKAGTDKLWISCETASCLLGYSAPNNNPANKVTVINTLNLNLPAGIWQLMP